MVAWQMFPVVAVLYMFSTCSYSMEKVGSRTEESDSGLAWDELHVCCGILHCEMSKSGS